ncbi:MAG TPA: YceI family protein [Candidatus Limnocylindrales bacterium]|nr:YceI family protein [Candidatus Limnocylindrales bacterium]
MNFKKNYFKKVIIYFLLFQGLIFIGTKHFFLTFPTYAKPAASSKPAFYKILPGLSQVKFYGSSPFDKFTGTSTQIEGFLEGPIETITQAPSSNLKAEVRVEARSLNTGNDRRDKKMRETLEVEKYPLITFKLGQVRLIQKASDTGPDRYKVEGMLGIHGVERPVTVEVESKREGNRVTISGKMPLDITDYQIDPPRVPVIVFVKMDKNVRVEFNLVAEASP